VWTSVWQFVGYASIMYIAVLAGIDPTLHEAALVDGASLFKRIVHIDIPGILPTATILFIMNCGSIMNVGFEKVYLMQNNMNMANSEVISTYVYKQGLLQGAQYSYSAAIGLFNSVINMAILVLVNWGARKVGETSLW
jgi:putative aldouronate transport system permease protein